MTSPEEGHNRGLPETPPDYTPSASSGQTPAPARRGAPKWMWLIPILASLLGLALVIFKLLTADQEIRGVVALVSVNAAMAESILAYLLVRSVDHMLRTR